MQIKKILLVEDLPEKAEEIKKFLPFCNRGNI